MTEVVQLYLVMFVFNALASFTHVAGKEAVVTISPFAVALFRFVLAVAALWALMRGTGRRVAVERVDWWRLFTLAVLAVPLNQVGFLYGLRLSPPSHAALLYATTPAWVLLIAVLLGIEKFRWWKWVGMGLAFAGVAILMGGEIASFRAEMAMGDLILLGAVLSWSAFTALGKPLVERYGALETTFVIMVLGTLLYLPFGAAAALTCDYSAATATGWLGILYMGLVTSGLCYFLWYWILARVRPTQVAVVASAQVPTTALFAWLLLGDIPAEHLVTSSLLVLGGIALMVGYGGPRRGVGGQEPTDSR